MLFVIASFVPRAWTVVTGSAEGNQPAASASPPRESIADPQMSALLADASRRPLRRDRVMREAAPPVELRFLLLTPSGAHADRVVAATKDAVTTFSDWYGPYPGSTLEVIEASWNSGLDGASYAGLVVTTRRWLTLNRDASLERALIAAVARQYWIGTIHDQSRNGWFEEGLVLYSAARAINVILENRDVAIVRYFGGCVPFAVRSVVQTRAPTDPRPAVRRFDEIESPAVAPWRAWSARVGGEAQRAALALHTLERYIGWPALQQALSAFAAHARRQPLTPADFAAIVGAQRGTDLGWFFGEAFRFDARFDYGIERFISEPASDATFQTVLRARRYGDGLFVGTSRPPSAGSPAVRALPVTIAFEDGTEIRDWWNGRDAELALEYVSRSRAVRASIDPEMVLLLDANRANNSHAIRPRVSPLGVRLALNWLVWLQHVVLTYTAIA